jgi:hypothetical protein
MSQNVHIRRLRPYLFTSFRRFQPTCHRSFHASNVIRSAQESEPTQYEGRKVTHDYERRVSQLESVSPAEQWYPRIDQSRDGQARIEQFRHKFYRLHNGETEKDVTVTITGKRHLYV